MSFEWVNVNHWKNSIKYYDQATLDDFMESSKDLESELEDALKEVVEYLAPI